MAKGVPSVRGWHASGDLIEVETASGTDRHVNTSDGWEVELNPGVDSRALFGALADLDVPVTRFERKVPSLHEIFIRAVGGKSDE